MAHIAEAEGRRRQKAHGPVKRTRQVKTAKAVGRPKGGIGFCNPSGPNPLSLVTKTLFFFKKTRIGGAKDLIDTSRCLSYK